MPSANQGCFATRLAALREARGLTQEQLAAASGVSRVQISRLEQGHFAPRLASLKCLAAALGVSVAQLMETERSR
jgi:transcriptional regulator with XRE-family HTH domain